MTPSEEDRELLKAISQNYRQTCINKGTSAKADEMHAPDLQLVSAFRLAAEQRGREGAAKVVDQQYDEAMHRVRAYEQSNEPTVAFGLRNDAAKLSVLANRIRNGGQA